MKNNFNQIRKTIDTNIFLSLSVFLFLITVGMIVSLTPFILTILFFSQWWLFLTIPLTVVGVVFCGVFFPIETMMWVEEWD